MISSLGSAGVPPKATKKTKILSSKATENMYKRFFAPKISELLNTDVPLTYKTKETKEGKKLMGTKKVKQPVNEKLLNKIKSRLHKTPATH